MKKLIKFYNFRKKGINFVGVIFLCSLLTFYESINSIKKISSELYLLASILFISSAIYSICYFLKEYKNSKYKK